MAIIQELESYVQSYPAGMDTVTDVSLSQNENGRQLRFKIIGVTIPAGSIAAISGTKPDGVVYSKAGTIEGPDTVIFDEDVQMTAVFGTWYAKIRIFNSGNTIASARVRFIIDKDPVDAGSVPSDSQLDGIIAEMEAYVEEARSVAYGSPLTASTAAAMTDQTKVYVYTGAETGYTAGHWYFWNGTEWHDGGVYNAVAVQTDKTLSVADKAADGKATGEALEHRIPVYSEDSYTSDSTPYLYRTTGGGVAVGTRELDEIVGGSVGWNQLVTNPIASKTVNGITFTVNADKSITINGTATAEAEFAYSRIDYLANHKYAILGIPSGASSSTYWLRALNGRNSGNNISTIANNDYWTTAIFVANGATVNNVVFRPNIIDLTLLLGSTIADYIYSLETATAGSGIAKLKEWGFFTEDYYAYDAGSLQSVSVSAHEMVGFNQWDEEWEVGGYSADTGAPVAYTDRIRSKNFIPVFPNTQYYFCCNEIASSNNVQQRYYDANGNFLGTGSTIYYNNVFTTPSNARYLKFSANTVYGTTYNHNICINISNTAKNGTYEPYTKHTYPLDSSLTLRGIPKLDSSNKLYYDGDVYKADGTVTRRYGIVDLGTLNWTYVSGNNSRMSAPLTMKNSGESGAVPVNAICSKYEVGSSNDIYSHTRDKIIGHHQGLQQLWVYDTAYTDATSFKSAMNGVYLVYELATPTTEQADPYASVQICAEGGTEEYVTTGIVPVGHTTKYPADLAGKLDSIPALPTTAGNYRLKVTVTGGVPLYEWVSA